MKEAKCKRPGSIYMAFGKRQYWIEEKQISHCQGLGGGQDLTLNWYVETLRNDELVLYFYFGGGYRTVMYLSKLIELCTKKAKNYCIQIIP